jgi:hypothetical protein
MSDDINRTSNPRCVGQFTASITSDVAAIVDPNSGVVPVIGSRRRARSRRIREHA